MVYLVEPEEYGCLRSSHFAEHPRRGPVCVSEKGTNSQQAKVAQNKPVDDLRQAEQRGVASTVKLQETKVVTIATSVCGFWRALKSDKEGKLPTAGSFRPCLI